MAGQEFRIRVITDFSTEGLREYVSEIERQIGRLGTGPVSAGTRSQIGSAQVAQYRQLQEELAKGNITPATYAQTTRGFEQAYGTRGYRPDTINRRVREQVERENANLPVNQRTVLPTRSVFRRVATERGKLQDAEDKASEAAIAAKTAETIETKKRATKVNAGAQLALEGDVEHNRTLKEETASRQRVNKRKEADALQENKSNSDYLRSLHSATVARKEAAVNARKLGDAERAAAGQTPSLFQKLYATAHSRPGQAPLSPYDSPSLGGFLTSSTLRTAGFAFSGAAIYGAVSGIKEMVKNAEELEKTFTLIRAQVRDPAEFEGLRKGIFDIARETGLASNEVATLTFQLRGAFGNSDQALANAHTAAQAVRVTGLELNEVTDSLTAAATSFNTDFAHIVDISLGLQERTGVLSKETIKATADLAPVAKDVGLTLRQTETLVATAQKYSGRAGSAIAEGFNRIFPAMEETSIQVVQLYSELPQLASGLDDVAAAVARGDYGDVLIKLIGDYKNLDATQQAYVINLLGGRREAQNLIPVLEHGSQVIAELSKNQNDAGKTATYFAQLQTSLSQRVARVSEQFRQLGQAIFDAGLGDLLKDAAGAGLLLLTAFAQLVNVFASINRATHGWAAQLVIVIALMKLLRAQSVQTAVTNVIGGQAGLGVLGGAFGGPNGLGLGAGLRALGGSQLARGGAYAAGGYAIEELSQHLFGKQSAGGQIGTSLGQAGIGAGLGYAVAGPYGAAAGALIAAGSKYTQTRSGTKGAERSLQEKLKTADTAQLRELAKGHTDLMGRLGNFFTGTTTVEDLAKQALAEQRKSGYANLPKSTQKATRAIESGALEKDWQTAQQEFQAGDRSAVSYLAALRHAQQAFEEIQKHGALSDKNAKAYAALQKEISKTYSDAHAEAAAFATELRQLAGTDSPDAQIAADVNLLRDTNFSDPKQRLDAAHRIIDAQKQKLEDAISAPNVSAAEALRLAREGIPILPEVRQELIAEAVRVSTDWQHVVEKAKDAGVIGGEVAKLIIGGDLDKAKKMLEDQVTFLEGILPYTDVHDRGSVAAQLERVKSALSAFEDATPPDVTDKGKVDPKEAAKLTENAALEAYQNLQAQREYDKALVARDPIALARLAQVQADDAAKEAKRTGNKAAQLQAAAQRVAADRSVQDALAASAAAERDILRAHFERLGDNVAIAQLGLDDANAELARARQQGAGSEIINQLEAARYRAETELTESRSRDKESLIDFQLQMHQITEQQAIADLEALAAVEQNEERRRSLLLKIQQLKEQLSQDLQFNLPRILGLPTLYEATRTSQGAAQGIGYQDNRQINVTINGADANVQQQLVDILNRPPRSGNYVPAF